MVHVGRLQVSMSMSTSSGCSLCMKLGFVWFPWEGNECLLYARRKEILSNQRSRLWRRLLCVNQSLFPFP